MLRREQRELTCVSCVVTFCSDVDEKSMILRARDALAPVFGRVPKGVAKKTIKTRNHLPFWELFFRAFRDFLTLGFSFIFEVTSDSEF